MNNSSDPALIERISRHDSEALRELYGLYGRVCFAMAYRVLGEATAAEEVVQDTFETIWHKAQTFDVARGGNVRGWVLTIANRKAIDARRKDRQRSVPLDDVDWALSVPDISVGIAEADLRQRVSRAVSELAEDQRQVIEMAYFDGYSQGEISESQAVPLGTVKSRTRLGLRKLAQMLQDERSEASLNGGRG